jgi:hypothetical protein
MAAYRVHRRDESRDVAPELVRFLCACALSAPTKSDLQQSDILIIREKEKRHAIGAHFPEMPWLIGVAIHRRARQRSCSPAWGTRPKPRSSAAVTIRQVAACRRRRLRAAAGMRAELAGAGAASRDIERAA